MNGFQEARMSKLNDRWGVARWEEIRTDVYFECDDGDKGTIHDDGTVTWSSPGHGDEGKYADL